MQVFIVHAHHEAQSFCSALRDVAVEVLSAAGHEVRQSDLYQMGFKAVADGTDFVGGPIHLISNIRPNSEARAKPMALPRISWRNRKNCCGPTT